MINQNLLPVVLGAVFSGLTFFGVILPAVWSTRPERRAAALETLKELLRALRRRG